MRLTRPFFSRSARTVAQALLGQRLVRLVDGQRLVGRIVETEAYCDADEPDLACHAHRANGGNPTPRTAVMFGPAGITYMAFTYGIHSLFNIVTGEAEQANGVLIRALEPQEGIVVMQANRGKRPLSQLTNGPGKLTQALALNQSHNLLDLCVPNGALWLEEERETAVLSSQISTGPRIGLGKTPEPWLSIPWRYWITNNPHVSKT